MVLHGIRYYRWEEYDKVFNHLDMLNAPLEGKDAVKEDSALNKKVLEATEAYTQNSTNLTELLTLIKTFDFFGLKSLVESLKAVGENFAHTVIEEPISYTEGEKVDIDTEEAAKKEPIKEPVVENVVQELVRATRLIPVTIVRPMMRPALELEMMSSASRIQLTDTILEVPTPQPTCLVIDITLPEQNKSLPVAPKVDKGKGIATNDVESPKKLVKDSSKVYPEPNEPVRVPYEIHGKLYHLTNDGIQEHLDKEEKIKKAVKEAKQLAMSKPELITVVHEEASKAAIDPKILKSAKGGQEFKKIEDTKMKVLNRENVEKIKSYRELMKKRIEKYRWTTTSRLKPKTITDVKIYPNTKPVAMTVFRGTDKRNFDVHNPFNFGDFSVTEWDKLRGIIPKKKNQVVKDLMNSLSKRYEKLRTTHGELGISSSLSAPGQVLSITLGRKRKIQEPEPEIRIPSLKCNRSLPESVPFVNNMVIEQPEYGMLFIDVFGDDAF
ncbi:hypothetical protein Tco_0454429 [Tanacetum coccineum]